jgi:hypothetical protein
MTCRVIAVGGRQADLEYPQAADYHV